MDSQGGSPKKRPRRGFVRRCERTCWAIITYFPLVFVYGLTTWAVYVEFSLCRRWASESWNGSVVLVLALVFYVLLNWSYSVCAFTDPGSPLSPPSSSDSSHDYSQLPTHEPSQGAEISSFTVKSTGESRFCKKCQTKKPDRAHHCSTCRRCVLKMDHHCPWLATCVGMRNYKAFILFCAYVTLFCYTCLATSTSIIWGEFPEYDATENMMGVNMILLAVISFIFGLVMTAFTSWHVSLALRNQTTIESLEKTRYKSPLVKGLQLAAAQGQYGSNADENQSLVQKYGQQLAEIHANAIPGVTRVEEGEEYEGDLEAQVTAAETSRLNYNDMELQRERHRYENYLDEKDSEKLPNAFDLGWRRNLGMLFGPSRVLWFLPICNTVGDGWHWEANPRWVTAREELRQSREARWRAQEIRERRAGWGGTPRYQMHGEDEEHVGPYLPTSNGVAAIPNAGRRTPGKANRILGRYDEYSDGGITANGRPGKRVSTDTLQTSGHRGDVDHASIHGLYDGGGEQDAETSEQDADGRRQYPTGPDEWRDWD